MRVYLVIGADRKVRAAKRPQIRDDEIAIAVDLHFSDAWGRVIKTIDVAVPDLVVDAGVDPGEASDG
jgi:hypothetical protein